MEVYPQYRFFLFLSVAILTQTIFARGPCASLDTDLCQYEQWLRGTVVYSDEQHTFGEQFCGTFYVRCLSVGSRCGKLRPRCHKFLFRSASNCCDADAAGDNDWRLRKKRQQKLRRGFGKSQSPVTQLRHTKRNRKSMYMESVFGKPRTLRRRMRRWTGLSSDKNIKSYIMEKRVSMKGIMDADRKNMMRKCGGTAWDTWSSGVKMWWRCQRPRLWIVLI